MAHRFDRRNRLDSAHALDCRRINAIQHRGIRSRHHDRHGPQERAHTARFYSLGSPSASRNALQDEHSTKSERVISLRSSCVARSADPQRPQNRAPLATLKPHLPHSVLLDDITYVSAVTTREPHRLQNLKLFLIGAEHLRHSSEGGCSSCSSSTRKRPAVFKIHASLALDTVAG